MNTDNEQRKQILDKVKTEQQWKHTWVRLCPQKKFSTRYVNTVAESQNEKDVQIQMRHKRKNEKHKRDAKKTIFLE
jgi:hypothetical protein